MRRILLCFYLILGLGCAAALAARENLAVNPGFETEASTNGLPGSWRLEQATGDTVAKLDHATARSGAASVRLKAQTASKCTLISHAFAVAPGDDLRFEAWTRATDLPPKSTAVSAGIAFRLQDGRIIQRDYFHTTITNRSWSRISGAAHAPADAVTAEVHLNYNNAPGTVWFDDVVAEITSPISFSLIQNARPWTGAQEITVRVTNRRANPFEGKVSCDIGKQISKIEAVVPAGQSRDLKVPITLNRVGSHRYTLALLDSTNAPVRLLHGEFSVEPPVVLFPACPCYQIAGEGDGSTRMDARVNLNPAQLNGLKLTFELRDSDGKTLQTIAADADQSGLVGCDLKVPVARTGAFTITASLADASGKRIGMDKTQVRVVEKNAAMVTVGPDGFLRVEGKPYFPIGLYSCANFEEMNKAGFNACHDYSNAYGDPDTAINPGDREVLKLLDKAVAHGMRMQIELPRKAIEQGKFEQLRRRIETFKHHPGLLCWGSEERIARETTSEQNVAKVHALVNELDPDHPFVLGDSRLPSRFMVGKERDFFPEADMDIGIWWWYPIPLREPVGGKLTEENLFAPPAWLTNTVVKKPLWIAIQAYQQPWKKSRFPTPAEYRCESYLSIIGGVKGLWYYTGYGEKDYFGKPAGLLNRPEDSHWDYVQKLVRELREFSPVIVSPRATAEITLSPANPYVEFTTRESDGKIYVIAANKAPQKQNAQFTSAAFRGRQARVLYEEDERSGHSLPAAGGERGMSAQVRGDALEDEFLPFAVHIYELSLAR